ncbi:peptide deformylase [Candidatus Woesearchaeota archaeon]|nr:peptide deformylase [Candidatus Woesearchaeota archaeon]
MTPVQDTRKILTHPHPLLRSACVPADVGRNGTAVQAASVLAALLAMDHPLKLVNGLAANQIGLDKRIVVLKRFPNRYHIMVNPEVVSSRLTIPSIEVCASLPGIVRMKLRKYWMRVRYHEPEGEIQHLSLFGSAAFTLQQELDHLDGRLIID